ncbi:MAG: DNA repair protein RecO [Clostridia bacterium]|nr:DNA repair protein RecO [Clostridia bacterium]
MKQTEHTAIVVHTSNYRDRDRMLTLFSPVKGKMDVIARGCRSPRSPLINASELFALGDFELYEKQGRQTVVSCQLIENFYPLREDYERLACGTFLLNLCGAVIQPMQPAQDLFMLLLHTLSRLAFSTQEWRPLLTGFFVHYAQDLGILPDMDRCLACGREMEEGSHAFFDMGRGGFTCHSCGKIDAAAVPFSGEQMAFIRKARRTGASEWTDSPACHAPFQAMKHYVESYLGTRLRSGLMIPE